MATYGAPRTGPVIDIRGLGQTNRLLREVSPDLRRQMFREVGSLVKKRVTAAKVKLPRVSGFAQQTTFLTKAGSKRSQMFGGGTRRQGLFGFQAITGAAYGSIIDLMERANTPRTSSMLATLEQRYGKAPRFLVGEFLPSGEGGSQMWRESRDIVERYIKQANELIDKAATVRKVG